MRALLDVSMLLALFDPKHVHHRRAHDWWGQSRDNGWATCPLTENGFLRIVTQQAYPNPLPFADALAMLRNWARPPLHSFWADDVSLLDEAVVDHARLLGPRQITDSYLLALAARHDGRLVTFDRRVSLTAIRGARPENLVMV
jgi:toxin-antitoxin system PIN domain toxin